MNVAIIGSGVGKTCVMSHLDMPIVILASQNEVNQFQKEPEPFVITAIQNDYIEYDNLTRIKKPVNKEWQKRLKNLQNSIQ